MKKSWKSPQALIVIALIAVIFTYIAVDISLTKPQMKSDILEIKNEYLELSGYLDEKLPEIDSTLRIQAEQISNQGSQIDSLNQTVKEIVTPD